MVCREGTQTYLDRLKKLSRHNGPDDLVFCGYDGKPVENLNKTFTTVLPRRFLFLPWNLFVLW